MINNREKRNKKQREKKKIFCERYRRVTGQKGSSGCWQGARESLEIARRLRVAYCRLNRRYPLGKIKDLGMEPRSISSRSSVDWFRASRSHCRWSGALDDASWPWSSCSWGSRTSSLWLLSLTSISSANFLQNFFKSWIFLFFFFFVDEKLE